MNAFDLIRLGVIIIAALPIIYIVRTEMKFRYEQRLRKIDDLLLNRQLISIERLMTK